MKNFLQETFEEENDLKNFRFFSYIFFFLATTLTCMQDCFAVPSYSRQTGLACSSCHSSFPELTSFGRQFKLNGYTITNIKTIDAPIDSVKNKLNLLTTPPVAGMIMSGFTALNKKMPGTQNYNVEFPEQLSLFYSGQVTPHIGTFVQLTYDPQGGSFGMDNIDVRYAQNVQVGKNTWIYGLTLNNNPTVQDIWNTVPAWRYPYASSGVAPSPAAATLIEGRLGQQVAGLGTYGMINNFVYYEASFYRSAPQGSVNPPDSSSQYTIAGVMPYWRLALHHHFSNHYLMIGTFGMSSDLFPSGTTGMKDSYSDMGLDLQYELGLESANISLHASMIRETRKLNATLETGGADRSSSGLNTFNIDGNVYFTRGPGITLGYFTTKGDKDNALYGTDNGRPDSNGTILELSFLPWYNTKFSIQYVMYNKFNGQRINFDGTGRNASQNNTLYCLMWINF
jgi:hypothetical protein